MMKLKKILMKKFILVDARPSGRFNGTSPEPRKEIESGAIPNSINIPYTDLIDQASGCYKKKDELKKSFPNIKLMKIQMLYFHADLVLLLV